ncbi:GDSL esterase/lipase At4g10955 [Pistacia vera]|uniref:GDSL esterase/lipase At4g10955 n=1 Tax=Pistacia vera TaxID=55513 RepID=UPI001263D79B|nr:GDSL esterase/lipase At4g10955 [Pistacia vera]
MAKVVAEEITTLGTTLGEKGTAMEIKDKEEAHPYAFHVSGPRNVAPPNWRDLINSSWSVPFFNFNLNISVLCERRFTTYGKSIKLAQTLVDERDGSIYGAILEWDRSAAMADLVLIRPSGAPKAVLALRGTLLKSSTIRRDVEDDLRFFAWESLKGSVRFKGALESLKSLAARYGSNNVCVAGHSLGAGFALQVGKTLAKEGLYVDTHLFNPPSVSLAMSFRNMGEKAVFAWNRVKSMLPSSAESQAAIDEGEKTNSVGLKNWVHYFYGDKTSAELNKWVPHLYVNNSDYICCSYTDPESTAENDANKENVSLTNGKAAAKLFVMSKGKQKFLEAHGIEQWWSDNLDLQMSLHNSKLISRQLRSLYSLPPQQKTPVKPRI